MNKEVDINRLNYESYVIDYLDGKLDAVETACFIAFLENNPEIKDEVEQLGDVKLTDDYTHFTDKDILKKSLIVPIGSINEDNYEDFFIAHYENDLSKSDEDNLLDFLTENTDLNDEYKLHGNLHIEASDEVFNNKELLKRKPIIGTVWYSSAAAAILLFMASWLFLTNETTKPLGEIAYIDPIKIYEIPDLLSSNQIYHFKIEQKQIHIIEKKADIHNTDNSQLLINRAEISIATVKTIPCDEQLVSYNFIGIIKQPKVVITDTPAEFNSDLALADNNINKNHKGLIARVFSSQISKITQSIKPNKTKYEKSNDPTYVKVIDGGLLVFNTLTGSETSTVKTYNGDGELTGYEIEGREMLLNRNFHGRTEN